MALTLSDGIKDGNAYTWNFLSDDIDAGDTIGLIKNTGNTNLRIAEININGGNAASLYTIHTHDATVAGTPAGTAVVAVSMSRSDNNKDVTSASAKADETGYASLGSVIEEAAVGATTRVSVNMHNRVVAPGATIAVDQETESTAGGMTIVGYFEN